MCLDDRTTLANETVVGLMWLSILTVDFAVDPAIDIPENTKSIFVKVYSYFTFTFKTNCDNWYLLVISSRKY